MSTDDTAVVALEPGSVVAGHRIERRLGGGGFGTVYAAVDLSLDRPVALKVLRRADAPLLARFRDEARLLARLNDPHVIQIYRVGQLPEGEPFLAMERFGDGSLADVVARGQPLPVDEAVPLVAQVLRALVAAHGAGIVHRDIKEANILVERRTGAVKLCDFGIARSQAGDGEANTGSQVIGTPHYLAPERFRGVRDDPRSDLYAVGVLLYRLLTGRRPFETPGANAMIIARRAATEDVAPPPAVPQAIARVCVALLARDPSLRPPSAHLALEALLRAWRAEPTASVAAPDALARAPLGVPLLEPPPRRAGWLVPAALAVAVAAALAATPCARPRRRRPSWRRAAGPAVDAAPATGRWARRRRGAGARCRNHAGFCRRAAAARAGGPRHASASDGASLEAVADAPLTSRAGQPPRAGGGDPAGDQRDTADRRISRTTVTLICPG
ncbi:MAG: serine/threonine protein kinase [Myxococcales bacterium]|nr:serine/threonine protein kinase [Myxococcales bacterium]